MTIRVAVTDPSQPVGGRIPEWLDETMMLRRTVLLRGPLDDALATEVAARLMTLDATGEERVLLHLGSSDGTLRAAFTVMDTIDALGVPVTAICWSCRRSRPGGPGGGSPPLGGAALQAAP